MLNNLLLLQYQQQRVYYNAINNASVRLCVCAYAQFNDNLFIQFSTWVSVFKIRHDFTVHGPKV